MKVPSKDGSAKSLRPAISKSRFTAGLQCHKRLYWQVHDPADLATATAIDSSASQGLEVGRLAHQIFPGGKSTFDATSGLGEALALTSALIENRSVPAIFEATFSFNGMVIKADILERRHANRWRLIEVKSTTTVKDHHRADLAIQYFVVTACGLDIESASLLHLNTSYVFDGKALDYRRLFTMADLTSDVKAAQAEIAREVNRQQEVLVRSGPPTVVPGDHCARPYPCEFALRCHVPPPENHIKVLPFISKKKEHDLALREVTLIKDIPDDFALSELQIRVRRSVREARPVFGDGLATELADLVYPLCFMDFETVFPAIPRFAGIRPYSHIPFQWSVHRQAAPGAGVDHLEFLWEDAGDPREQFVDSLLGVLGTEGHILSYNASFESQRLKELGDWFPSRRRSIEQVRERLRDLLPIVKRNVYHPSFNGSFSLKFVLPALVPTLTYSGMQVANGTDAGEAWEAFVAMPMGPEREQVRQALLAYCRQDTWALVVLLDYLRRAPHHGHECVA